MSAPVAEKGTIVVADISGYTKFLTTSELEHGHAIVRELLGTVKSQLGETFKVIRTEGDALFGYIPDDGIDEPAYLLDMVEATYNAFADHKLQVKVGSTCTCNACANSASLDLKLVAHHAEFLVEDLGGGRPDLSGPDVILAHRLLKNSFKEATGVGAYFMATDAVFDRLERPEGAIEHREEYEHFPEVKVWGFDLQKALERRRNENRTLVRPDAADIRVERVLPVGPAMAWAWLTEPAKMNRYGGDNEFSWGGGKGRQKGAQMHCAHGGGVSVMKIVDWKPFEHYTLETTKSFTFPAMHVSYLLKPLDGGRTRVMTTCKMLAPGLLARALKGPFAGMMRKVLGANLERLEEVLRAEGLANADESASAD